MKRESALLSRVGLIVLVSVSAAVAVVILLGFGYRATQEWQQSSQLLMTLDRRNVSDLLVTAVTRDMAAVQLRVLANRDWLQPADSLADTSSQVAVAFTRYPYPESFFTWNTTDSDVVFFNRVNRYPTWMPKNSLSRPPVLLFRNPPMADELRARVDAYGVGRFQYVALDMDFAGQPYQVVARLMYSDELQERPYSVIGFTVNLAWVRSSYFVELLSQVAPLEKANLHIGVIDDHGQLAWGTEDGQDEMVREFPLVFLNASLGKVALAPRPSPRMWKIRVGWSLDSPGLLASRQTSEAMLVAGSASVVLFVALIIAVRAVQADAEVSALRSDFVSSVTHSLKMPLANISVIADTLSLRPATGEKVQKYAKLLKNDSKRLTRLIDNLLAHARVTDVADLYSFQPIGVPKMVSDVVQEFRQPLAERNLVLEIDVPANLPVVRADRSAMMLALSNLLDNAIQYSHDNGSLLVKARHKGVLVVVEVHDRGVGIPEDELAAVQRKFVRGRLALSGGAGIGLSIVSQILKQHNGTFELESRLGVGTIARICVPVG